MSYTRLYNSRLDPGLQLRCLQVQPTTVPRALFVTIEIDNRQTWAAANDIFVNENNTISEIICRTKITV